MSKKSNVLILVALVAIVFVGLFLYFNNPKSPAMENEQAAPVGGTSISATNTSDAALTSDEAALGDQLNSLDQDLSAVDQGLSDRPVEQSY